MPAEAARAGRCALLLGVALLLAPWAGHVDDTDAQLYQVVARHMVEDGTWTELRYLPQVHAQFREHLPFGLWPMALAIRLGGEPLLAPLTALWSLGVLLLTAWLARRLLGRGEAVVAVLVLALCESFFRFGGRPRLDPPLMLFSLLAAAPLLLPRLRARGWALATLAGAVAALVKGPFGVLPLLAVTAASAWEARSWRRLLLGGLAAALALLPVAAFLAWDALRGDGSWWVGYGQHQLLASAAGARTDGATAWWFPLATIARRFWPGFPLLLAALVLRFRRGGQEAAPALRVLVLSCVLLLAALCLPSRKVWNHALVAYPLLALLAGAGARPLLQWLARDPRRAQRARVGLCAVALLVAGAAALGAGRLVQPTPCVASRELAPFLDGLAPGTALPVVSRRPAWPLVASLAAERHLAPAPRSELPGPVRAGGAQWVLAEEALIGAPPSPWRLRARARGWLLLEQGP